MKPQYNPPPSRHLGCRLLTGLMLLFAIPAAQACTTAVLGSSDSPVVVYSYDQRWSGAGVILVNPAGAGRTSIMEPPAAEWRVRYGSVTFNQIGQGMPTAGMNAQGLVVTLMWNGDVSYPIADERPVLNELELIQFWLDTAGSVEEALKSLPRYRVDGLVPIHFMLSDAAGDTATVAHVDGAPVINRGSSLPHPALTNTTYSRVVADVLRYRPFGGADALPDQGGRSVQDPGSAVRFARMALAARSVVPADNPNMSFRVLDQVRTSETQWNIVFDPIALEVHYRTATAPVIRHLRFADLDFSCTPTPAFQDVDEVATHALTKRDQPFMREANEALLAETLRSLPQLSALGPNAHEDLARTQSAALTCPAG